MNKSKNKSLFPFITVLFLTSCVQKHEGEQKTGLISNFVSISDNEDKGIKEIIGFYGGQCEYGWGISTATNEENGKYFWLKFSKSESIESLSNVAEMPGSNMAYIFYKNLDEEKNKYSEIRSELLFNDGTSLKFAYPASQLEMVKNKMSLVSKIVDLIKDKNFEAIKSYLNPDTSVVNYDKNELVSNLSKIDTTFGHVKEFRPYGFRFFQTKSGFKILHISGMIVRDKQSNEFSVDLNPDSTLDKVYALNYTF